MNSGIRSLPPLPIVSDVRLLIVEDEFLQAEAIRRKLTTLGYAHCQVTLSAAEAQKAIGSSVPDLVLLDIMMGKDPYAGIRLAEDLRRRHIPFVFLTSHAEPDVIEQAKATHPYGYLMKPVRESNLYTTIEVGLHRAAYDRLERLSQRLEQERAYLVEENQAPHNVAEIIGESEILKDTLRMVSLVAPLTTTVLLEGETGTGKELLARAIHQQSPRSERTFVKVNCAAIPKDLFESELFGHEKGSFTGALRQRIGKFELAHQSSIFLDEVGELPLSMQAKLLRVLQEKEVERVGGQHPRAIDVRVIAATNRHLEAEVAAGRFRADLFYRLNAFPIDVPALRERREDVPQLAAHFLAQCNQRIGRNFHRIATEALHEMTVYHWPGNVRELMQVIEHSAILSNGSQLTLGRPLLKSRSETTEGSSAIKTLAEVERTHIETVLMLTDYRVRGKGGAAELLDINPNTLDGRIRKLGVARK